MPTFLIIFIIFFAILLRCIVIVPQSFAYVVEFLGTYQGTWNQGLHIKIPILQKISAKVSLKEQLADFPPQSVITKDNVTMQIDTVVYFNIIDPKLYKYGVERPIVAIENLTATTLRNIIGSMTLDETLTSRDAANEQIKEYIDRATDPWGIRVNRVEIQNIIPPASIQQAMEKQMKAERERREAILKAEGEKKSAIMIAEGHKESAILEAEAKKAAAILEADAEKEAAIKRAEGQSEAILTIRRAEAEAYSLLVKALTVEGVLQLRGYEALEKMGEAPSSKIIIPSELQGAAGTIKALAEVADVKEGIKQETEKTGGITAVKKPERDIRVKKLDSKVNMGAQGEFYKENDSSGIDLSRDPFED